MKEFRQMSSLLSRKKCNLLKYITCTETYLDIYMRIAIEISSTCLYIKTYKTHRETYSYIYICICTKSLQSWLTLCDPMYCSPPGSSVHGILQARKLEMVAMPFSRGRSQTRDETHISMSLALAGGFFTTSTTWEAYL